MQVEEKQKRHRNKGGVHLKTEVETREVLPQAKDQSDLAVAAADVFLELCCFFDDPTDVGNLISGSSAFSKSSLNIWKFMVNVLLKPGLENFEHCFASM